MEKKKNHSSMFGKKDDDTDPFAGLLTHNISTLMNSLLPQVDTKYKIAKPIELLNQVW